jgi:collagen type III alpha
MQRSGRGDFMRMFPLMVALDADEDGEISADEIKNASKALKKLDKNGDGKLDREELRPQFGGPGGQGQPGPRIGPGGDRPAERPGPRGQGRPGQAPGPGTPGGGRDPEAFVQRIMSLDKNGDGKVGKDELPERMQRILSRADTDGDDAISEEEAKALAEEFTRRGGGAGRGQGGQRPARSQRPEASF